MNDRPHDPGHEPAATPPAERSEAPVPVPRFVAWVGRHSGWLIFLTLLAVALLEGLVLPLTGRPGGR